MQCLAHALEGGSVPCEVNESIDDSVIEAFCQGLCWTQPAKVMLCDFLISNVALTLGGMSEYHLGL